MGYSLMFFWVVFFYVLNEYEKSLIINMTTKILGKIKIDRRDGLRFDFKEGWLQIRSSNTEPIFRLIAETSDKKLTDSLLKKVKKYFK